MKKLAILLLVLGFVSIVNAGTVDLVITSLNGQPIDPYKEIIICSSDVIGLTIYYRDDTGSFNLVNIGFDIVVTGPGTLDMSQAGLNPLYNIGAGIIPPIGVDGVASGTMPRDGDIIVENIFFHCDGIGSVIVELVNNSDYPSGGTYEVSDDWSILRTPQFSSVIVYQGCGELICWDCPGQPLGDANGDGRVNVYDLIPFKIAFGSMASIDPSYDCCADFTHDGKVNVFDLIRLKQNWGATGLGACAYTTCP